MMDSPVLDLVEELAHPDLTAHVDRSSAAQAGVSQLSGAGGDWGDGCVLSRKRTTWKLENGPVVRDQFQKSPSRFGGSM